MQGVHAFLYEVSRERTFGLGMYLWMAFFVAMFCFPFWVFLQIDPRQTINMLLESRQKLVLCGVYMVFSFLHVNKYFIDMPLWPVHMLSSIFLMPWVLVLVPYGRWIWNGMNAMTPVLKLPPPLPPHHQELFFGASALPLEELLEEDEEEEEEEEEKEERSYDEDDDDEERSYEEDRRRSNRVRTVHSSTRGRKKTGSSASGRASMADTGKHKEARPRDSPMDRSARKAKSPAYEGPPSHLAEGPISRATEAPKRRNQADAAPREDDGSGNSDPME